MTISNYLLSLQTSNMQTFSSLSADTFSSYFTEKVDASEEKPHILLPSHWPRCVNPPVPLRAMSALLSQAILSLHPGSHPLLQSSTLSSSTHFPSLLEYSYLDTFNYHHPSWATPPLSSLTKYCYVLPFTVKLIELPLLKVFVSLFSFSVEFMTTWLPSTLLDWTSLVKVNNDHKWQIKWQFK